MVVGLAGGTFGGEFQHQGARGRALWGGDTFGGLGLAENERCLHCLGQGEPAERPPPRGLGLAPAIPLVGASEARASPAERAAPGYPS